MKTTKILVIVLMFLIFLSLGIGVNATSTKSISSWLPYWDIKKGLGAAENNLLISDMGLFFYAFDKNGNIINLARDQQIDFKGISSSLRKANIKLIPTLTNDIIYSKTDKKLKDPEILHKILSDDTQRHKHIQQILEIIKEINADGVDIDYESVDIKDKDVFSLFIKELSAMLHIESRILIVTVQQKTEDHQRPGAGAVDWKAISVYADKIIIMCYNYSSRLSKAGPICPAYWLKDIIEFAITQIPQEKICISLPLYGYDWSGGQAHSLNYQKAQALIEKYSAKVLWDKKSLTPYFSYYENKIKHIVWFEDPKSLSEKIKIIKKANIPHLALWHIGMLDHNFSDSMDLFLE